MHIQSIRDFGFNRLLCTCICIPILILSDGINGFMTVSTKFEFENLAGGPGMPRSPWRSGASGVSSLHMFEGDTINITLCLSETTEIVIDELVYSNDGESDIININIDDIYFPWFKTEETDGGWGKYWNIFKSSGILGEPVILNKGSHTIGVTIESADYYGVEFDVIKVSAEVENESQIMWCETKLIKSPTPSIRAQEIDSIKADVVSLEIGTHNTEVNGKFNQEVENTLHTGPRFEIKTNNVPDSRRGVESVKGAHLATQSDKRNAELQSTDILIHETTPIDYTITRETSSEIPHTIPASEPETSTASLAYLTTTKVTEKQNGNNEFNSLKYSQPSIVVELDGKVLSNLIFLRKLSSFLRTH